MNEQRRGQAEQLRRLHHGPSTLVLPNAWDAVSAKLFERSGFAAIGTSSAGIAASLGYPDGQQIPLDELLFVLRRIVQTVDVPVSADMEAGFGTSAAEVSETVRHVISAGVVGINLEDVQDYATNELSDAGEQARKLEAIREAALQEGVPLVINARTDLYWLQIGPPEERLNETIARAKAYLGSGADCIFIPGVKDEETISTLVEELKCPLNMLAGPGALPVSRLQQLGVARVSVGSGPMRATLALINKISRELLEAGTYTAFAEEQIPYDEVNLLFQ